MTQPPRSVPSKQFAGLEICRFLCAVAVVFWHYQHFFLLGPWPGSMAPIDRTAFPLYSMFELFYENGDKAVPIFWVISGFIFFWKYGEGIHDRRWGAEAFFIWRVSRLYPLHFASLLCVAGLQYVYMASHDGPFIYSHNDAPHFILQLVLASNWLGSEPFTFNGPIWSISAEILAYATFYGFARLVRPTWAKSLLVIGVASLILRVRDDQPVVSCILFFFAGGLLHQGLAYLGRRGTQAAFWAMLGAVAAIATAGHFGVAIKREMLLALAVCTVGVCVTVDKAITLHLARAVPLGNLTYASYLVHFPVQLVLVLTVDALGYERQVFFSPMTLGVFLGATFGSAYVIHQGFEMPAQDAIRAIWRRHRVAGPKSYGARQP